MDAKSEARMAGRTPIPSGWLVPDVVEIREGRVIAGSTGREDRLYFPVNHPELITLFQKVKDEAGLLDFIRRFGLLGQHEMNRSRILLARTALLEVGKSEDAEALMHSGGLRPGDSVEWCLAHATTTRLVWEALMTAEKGSDAEVVNLANRIQNGVPVAIEHAATVRIRFGIIEGDARAYLRGFAANVLSRNLENSIKPVISRDASRPSLVIKTLIHWIYWYLANRDQWSRCLWCGSLFAKEHGKLQYCPGTSCGSNYRSTKNRVVKELKNGLAQGQDKETLLMQAVEHWNRNSHVSKITTDIEEWLKEAEEEES